LQLAIGGDMQVRQVAGVRALGGHEAVLGLVRVEVRAGRFEVGGLAFACRMDVEAMLARRDGRKIEADEHSARRDSQSGRADLLAARVLKHGRGSVHRQGRRGERERSSD
jgi:hypothetical protein